MKPFLTSFLFVYLLFLGSTTYSQEELKIMSYNVRNGAGMDKRIDYNRTAKVINQYKPDIIAVQELDSGTNRSSQRFVLEEIATRLEMDMHYVYSPAIQYDGGKYGTGILSKEQPIRTYRRSLPGKEERRTLLIAEFEKYVFICVHLSLAERDQVESLKIINKELDKFQKPVIIAGDFNAEPKSTAIKNLQEKFDILTELGAKTYPADKPKESIDYIAIDKKSSDKYLLKETFVIADSESSDHRPIVASIEFK